MRIVWHTVLCDEKSRFEILGRLGVVPLLEGLHASIRGHLPAQVLGIDAGHTEQQPEHCYGPTQGMTAPGAPRHAPTSQHLGHSVVRCTRLRLSVLEASVCLELGNRVRARLSHRFLHHGARFPASLSVVSHATYGVPAAAVLAWAVFPR